MTFRKTFALFAAFAHAGCTTKNSEKVEKTTAVATEVLKDAVAEHVGQELIPYLESLVEAQKEEIDGMKKDIKSLSEKFEDYSESTKRFAEWTKNHANSRLFKTESETDDVETADSTDENFSEDSGEPEIYEPRLVGWEENQKENQRLESARRHANKERLIFGEPAQVYPDTNMLQTYNDTVEDSADMNIITPVLSKTETNRLLESTDKTKSEDNLVEANINESVKTTKEVEENKYVDSDDEFVKQLLVDQQKRKEKLVKLEKAQAEEATKVLKEWNDKQDREKQEKKMKAAAKLSEDQGVYHGDSQLFW